MEPSKAKFQTLIKYFVDKYSLELLLDGKGISNWQQERSRFYFAKLLEFSMALEKIRKYKLYFSEFYPVTTNISEAEVIEYHWHSYVQDFYILKERAIKPIGALQNDLSRYGISNPGDIKKALEHLKVQVIKNLRQANELRRKQTHDTTILDAGLVRAKALKIIEGLNKTYVFDSGEIEREYRELIEKKKQQFIDMATRNDIGMQALCDFYIPRFGYIFALLNGDDPSIFEM